MAGDDVVQVYLLRHGPAADRSAWTGEDADRPLTDKGRRTVHRVAAALDALGVRPDVVVTSPYARAAETADIVAETLGVTGGAARDARLAGAVDGASARAVVGEHGEASVVMLVGHEPHLSSAAGELCGGARLLLRKAGVARVDLDRRGRGPGLLVWLAQPDQLAP